MTDLKNAARSLRGEPSLTLVAIVVLTLGIGASTAIFSVVDAVVLRSLPFDDAERLVAVGERRPRSLTAQAPSDPAALAPVAPQNFVDWAARQQVFTSFAAFAYGGFTLHGPGAEPEALRAMRVTAQFFDVLRAVPAAGRTFTAENEVDGRHRIAVLSDAFWRRRFGADPRAIGRTIALDGVPYEVAGVMDARFTYPLIAARPTDVWVPYVAPPDERTRVSGSRSYYLQAIGRLKPGVSIAQAQAQMTQIAAALEQTHPVWNKDHRIGVRPLNDHLVGANTKSWMLLLLGAVAIVLLIACANVANLLLARATVREREIGIRAALGASRPRLVRQLIAESVLLSTVGAAFGMVFGWWGVNLLRLSLPEGIPRVASIGLNFRVFAAAAALAVVTGVLFGLYPALQLSRPDLTSSLKERGRGTSGGSVRRRLRSGLVVAEVGLAMVLLVGAALFAESFRKVSGIDPGFNPERVLTGFLSPRIVPGAPLPDSAGAFAEIVDRIQQIPGVAQASISAGGLPLSGGMSTTDVAVQGKAVEKGTVISIRSVTSDYHRALGIPLRAGRLLQPSDRADSQGVVIINEAAARKYLAGEDPLGRALIIRGKPLTIVGVVGDVRQTSLETEPMEEAYVPFAQRSRPTGELAIRTTGDPHAIVAAVKAAVHDVLPDVPLRNVRTMEEMMASQIAQRRLNMLLLGLFGILGLAIAAVGLYGVMSYVVSQRTREIGVRIALGATAYEVIGMVMRNAGSLLAAGLIIGSLAAWQLRAIAAKFLYGLEPTDPRAFIAAVIVLSASALVASLIPARRAASVDPVVALRAD